jgi:hypothetical protein
MAGVVVSIILFFYWKSIGEEDKAQLCYTISELILLTLLTINSVIGMRQLFNFVYNLNNSNTLDHALLLVPVTSLLILELFTVLAMVIYMSEHEPATVVVLTLVVAILSILQGIIQIAFIVDGMQRVTVEENHVRQKHGRGVITFLIVLNVAMWVFESFQEKKTDQEVMMDTYGEVAWSIISSIAFPLELFFYFHSAICLAHMWRHCYTKPETDVINKHMLQ